MRGTRFGVDGMARRWSGTLLVAAALGACIEFPGVPEDGLACSTEIYLGSFRGRASGESTDSLMGCAFFTRDTITREFGMVLTNGGPFANAPRIKLFRDAAPAAGRIYTIGPASDQLWGVMFLGTKTFTLTSGTFRTRSDDYNPSLYSASYFLQGELDVTATDSTGAVLTVVGEFKSLCIGEQEVADRRDEPTNKKVKACDPTYSAVRAH